MTRQAAELTEPSAPTLFASLRGPRYVDLPLRILVLIVGAMRMAPGASEATGPPFWISHSLAAILIISTCVAPVAAGLAGFLTFAVYAVTFPDLVNPFHTVGAVAVALILSHRRLRLAVLFTLTQFAIVLIHTSNGLPGEEGAFLVTRTFEWLFAVVLGLSAAAVEQRIRAEISSREDLARIHRRRLDTIRLDIHDTVSHGLAAEAAIVRVLKVDARPEGGADSTLTELALLNAHTQQQLRVLLSRLTDDSMGHCVRGDLEIEMLRAAEMIRAATDAGGFTIDIAVGKLPSEVPAEVLETALLTLKELATNIVKHTSGGTAGAITVREVSEPGSCIRFEATNPSLKAPGHPPRSLSARIQRAGGSLSLHHRDRLLTVQATIPATWKTDTSPPRTRDPR